MPCYCAYRPFTLYARHDSERYTPIGLSDIERLRLRGLADHAARTSEGPEGGNPKGGAVAVERADEDLLSWALRRRRERDANDDTAC